MDQRIGYSGPPPLLEQAWSVTKAIARFVAGGFETVDAATYRTRLEICDACSQRDDHRCRVCGCFVALKAKLSHEMCPNGKWP